MRTLRFVAGYLLPALISATAAAQPADTLESAPAAAEPADHSATVAEAAPADRLDQPVVDVHGFVSQGFILTTENNFLADSEGGSFEFAEVGINFTKQLTEELRFGVQLFARDLGPIGNYSARVDWFYLDYRWTDWLGLRAGRVKVPFGLYNEINDVDAARVPILLPQSTYPTTNRDFLLAQTGIELYGLFDMGKAGRLDYVGYLGTNFLENTPQPGRPFEVATLKTSYVVGGRLMWETPLPGLRAGGSIQALELDADLLFGMDLVDAKIPAVLWVGSLEYVYGDFLVAAEYGRWHVEVESSRPDLFPELQVDSERFYLLATYRVSPWLHPGIYYSQLAPNVDKYSVFDPKDSHTRADVQRDLAVTLRFDINQHWLVKVEAHGMSGTALLTRPLNDNRALTELESNWVVFLAKTTAYF